MNSLQIASRSIVRARAFSAAMATTIALTVAAGCTVFGLVNAILLRPLPYENANRLVGLWHTLPGVSIPLAKQSPGTYAVYREKSRSFEQIGVFVALATTLSDESTQAPPERIRVGWMTPSMFDVLGIAPTQGRIFKDADALPEAQPVVVISERLWRSRLGGKPDVIGRTIGLDGRRYTIIGIMPAAFAFPDAGTPAWAPLDLSHPTYLGSFGYDGLGLLKAGVSPAAAERELASILPRAAERFPEQRPGVSSAAVLRDTKAAPVVHLMRDDVIAGVDRVLLLIAGAAGLLLLVALSTVASLSIVRIESRQRELAIRSAVGASRTRLFGNVVLESTLVAVTGAGLGLLAATFAIPLIVQLAPNTVPRLNEIRVDSAVFGVAIILMLVFIIVSSAIGLTRVRTPNGSLAFRGAGAHQNSAATMRLRTLFVIVEVAMSLVLLSASGVLGRSIVRLRAVDPGFDPSNLFTFWTYVPGTSYRHDGDVDRFFQDAIARFARLPGVISVAATAKLPLEVEGSPYRIAIWTDDGSSAQSTFRPPVVQATTTSSGYFNTMRIPVLTGRSFDDSNVRRGALEAVVSRRFASDVWHDASGRTSLGKRLRPTATGPWFTVVGVVDDVRDSTVTLPPVAEVYFDQAASGPALTPQQRAQGAGSSTISRDMAFVVRTRGTMPHIGELLRAELRALDPNLPFHRPAMMTEAVADSRSRMTFSLIVLTVGATAALLLGVIGLYGALAYVVSLRAREISIRIALGLYPAKAARLVLRHGFVILSTGAVIGSVAFALFAKLLSSLTFEVHALDPAAIAAALIVVAMIGVSAMWVPANRAASVNPADALKAD